MQHPTASTFIGSGKVLELAAAVKALRVEAVVFDDELSPAQGFNLQKALGGVVVIDRTTLILQIFAQRARTREAKLQVAAARTRYMLPRLQTMSGFLTTGAGMDARGGSGGGGGQFLKGSGESQIETDKRLFRKQLSKIEADMAEIAKVNPNPNPDPAPEPEPESQP
eukprot:7053110-Prymnesium_polylepis.1